MENNWQKRSVYTWVVTWVCEWSHAEGCVRLSLGCDPKRCVRERVWLLHRSSLMIQLPPVTLYVPHTHTHIIQRIPTRMMTPWTGATASLTVWLSVSPAEMDITVPHHASFISLFLEAVCANGPLHLLLPPEKEIALFLLLNTTDFLICG